MHGLHDKLSDQHGGDAFQALTLAEGALKAAGVPVETIARPGLAHGIDEEGLRQGSRFLREVLKGGS